MITRSHYLKLNLNGTLFQDYNKSSLLFFDIETTGFQAKNSFIYLIGAISWQDNSWICTQWFAEDPDHEMEIINAFLAFAKNRTLLVHFNGERFDIPFINEKCRHYHLGSSLSSINSRDLFRMIRPLKKLISLDSLKQKNLEEFMGIHRKDPFTGGELIHVYEKYVQQNDSVMLEQLLQHNFDDLIGLACILPLLSYQTIPNLNFTVMNYEVNGDSLDIHARLPIPLPKKMEYKTEIFTILAEKDQMLITIAGTREPLKYFYKDYKNYYYLPKEDTAIHKSVAVYVDKEFREPAKASNCYTRKKGFYLPQPEELFTPIYKKNYEDKLLYFSCTDKILENRENILSYVSLLFSEI